MADGACDCAGNTADECGECGGSGPAAGFDCDGNCLNDADGDGVCDENELGGCTDDTACNYDAAATDDDESCLTDDACGICGGSGPAEGYDCNGDCLNDSDSDGVCDEFETSGCTDSSACNYDASASDDDGSCLTDDACGICGGSGPAEGYDCNGDCLNDADSDGVCDELEIEGCTNASANNYDESATDDDGSCSLEPFPFLSAELYSSSEYGSTYRVYANFEDPLDECVAIYSIGTNEADPVSLETYVSTSFYQHAMGANLGSEISPFFLTIDPTLGYDSWFTIGSETTEDGTVSTIGMTASFEAFNEGTGFVLSGETGGSWYVTPGSNTGSIAGDDGKVLLAQLTAVDGEDIGNVSGTWNMQWRNAIGVSSNMTGLQFDSQIYIDGCMDSLACNYDETANVDDGSCSFAISGYDCDGNCVNDADGDGVCDEFEVGGCMDAAACNYAVAATDDDGSCLELDECGICGGSGISEGECDCAGNVIDECGECGGGGIAEGACDCEGNEPDLGYDCSGECLSDMDGDGVCDVFEIAGCTDGSACNYDASATDEDGTCSYAAENYDCLGLCINDFDGDGVCDEIEVMGCTSTSAENYEVTATDDDGTCVWAGGLFTGISYELIGHDLVDETSTYRLYANFNPETFVQVTACFGTEVDNWVISSTESFHQDPNGAMLAQSINPAFFAYFPELEFDTWLALGGGPGSPVDLQTVGLDNFFNDFEDNGGDVLVNTAVGASLYYIPGESSSDLSIVSEGQMLLGQFTTSGVVSVKYNLQYRDENQITHYATDLNLAFPTFGVGCTDSEACNYDLEATDDDGTCYYDSEFRDCDGVCLSDTDGDDVCDAEEVIGCTDAPAWNYNAEATEEDGSCLYAGCHDELACNYEPTTDVGVEELCVYPAPYSDCDGNCNGDYEGDGVEECAEVSGCASESASNYNPEATNDDGSCTWGDGTFLGLSYEIVGENTIGSDVTYRLSANFDPSAEVDMTSLFGNADYPWLTMSTGDFYQHPLGADFGGNINPGFFATFPELEFDSWLTIGAAPGDYNALAQENMYLYLPTFNDGDDLIIDSPAGAQIFLNPGASDTQGVPDENGDLLLGQFTTSGVVFIRYNIRFQDAEGNIYEFTDIELTFPPIEGGCTDAMASNYDVTANFDDMSCFYEGCTDSTADNYNPASTLNDGTCLYTGCMDTEADNYNAQANTGDQEGLCEYFGCTDSEADNYDAEANVDDGTCLYTGCTDSEADNYDSQANTGDQEALCEYLGCTDAAADNYDAGANIENGTCLYTGCMDSEADNYNAQANTGDQAAECLYTGCMDSGADNYDAQANTGDQGALCLFTGCYDEVASNYNAEANTGDQEALCEYLGCTNADADNFDVGANVDDGSCVVAGCMYMAANNYNALATYDNGTCLFPLQGCTDPEAFNYDAQSITDNGSCLYGGCTYIDADNYDDSATVDDGSCYYSGCMDATAANYDDTATVDDGSCLVVGCMDPDGLNYDSTANFSGGCDYPDACIGDINYDGFVDVTDLLTFFQYYGTTCEE